MKKQIRNLALLMAMVLGCVSGCGKSELAKEFRETAADSFQTSIHSLADGLIDGAFAVYDPDS
ncbi:MAG: hypothetical protein JXB13_11215 [Phycisphaerae bacterium]|nr:hypothetical protein [Phycisphaerae bacterium]